MAGIPKEESIRKPWQRKFVLPLILGGGILLGYDVSLLASYLAGVASEISLKAQRYRAPEKIREYIQSHPVRGLQIGAGGVNLSGWLNTDLEPGTGQTYLDVTKPFPLPDGSFNYIFGEHVIEHISYENGLAMLRECYRVLAPGGKIRLATPDLMKYFHLLQNAESDPAQQYIAAKLKFHKWPRTPQPATYIFNEEVRSFGHQFIYDRPTLENSLAQAGFRSIVTFPPGQSDDPVLQGIEARHNLDAVRPMNDYESMVLQALHP